MRNSKLSRVNFPRKKQICAPASRDPLERSEQQSKPSNERERERSIQRKHEHERHSEDIKNKNLEDINVLRITLENQIEELERQFEQKC